MQRKQLAELGNMQYNNTDFRQNAQKKLKNQEKE